MQCRTHIRLLFANRRNSTLADSPPFRNPCGAGCQPAAGLPTPQAVSAGSCTFSAVSRQQFKMRLIPLLLAAPLFAQSQTFEAASVKPDKDCPGHYSRNFLPGRLTMNCWSIQELVAFAWGFRNEQVVGQSLPGRYAIEATFDAAAPPNQIYGAMLQALLADRFSLKVHREFRELPVYNLVVAKNGAKMPPTKSDCVVAPADGGPPLPPGQYPRFLCNHPNTGSRGYNWTLEGKSITMKSLADMLSRTQLHRTVVDKTGLTGAFDITLHWEIDPSSPLYDGIGGAPAQTSEPGGGPSIFTAIEEQLGLKLQSARGPDEVLVIDHAEKP
jgi:uncharacterized protein (TIGR03435 family)